MRSNWGLLLTGFILGIILLFLLVHRSGATQVPKVDWCHCEPNGQCQSLSLPQAALQQAGHVDANGNPLHAGDYAGVCILIPVVTNTLTPTVTPTVSPAPTDTVKFTGQSDGKSDNLGCSTHDCSRQVPAGPPATGYGPTLIPQVGWK